MEAREYQLKVVEEVRKNKSNLIILPMRAGKSYVIKLLTEKFEGKVLIGLGRKEIIKQLKEMFGNEATVIMNKEKYEKDKRIVIGSFQTLINRKIDYSEYEVFIQDEVHERTNTEIVKKIKKYVKTVIGLTGTPLTQSNKLLDGWDKWIQPITIVEMIKNKWLAPTNFYSKSKKGDRYGLTSEKEEIIREIYTKQHTIERLERFIRRKKLNKRRKVLVYVNFIDTANELYERIKDLENIYIHHSKVKDADKQLEEYKKREKGIIISVRSLAVGVNIPDADTLLYGIYTTIHALALQIAWRASTYLPNKVATVYDFTGQFTVVNPTTDFKEYKKGNTCKEECKVNFSEYTREYSACIASCSMDTNTYCGSDTTEYKEYASEFKIIKGVPCGIMGKNKIWKEEIENSIGVYVYRECKVCGAITRYKIEPPKDPHLFVRLDIGTVNKGYLIYVKEEKKAVLIVDKIDDELLRYHIVEDAEEVFKIIEKRYKQLAIVSNIQTSKIPNVQVDWKLNYMIKYIDFNRITKFMKLYLIDMLRIIAKNIGFKEGIVYYMRRNITRKTEKKILKYINQGFHTKRNFLELKREIE